MLSSIEEYNRNSRLSLLDNSGRNVENLCKVCILRWLQPIRYYTLVDILFLGEPMVQHKIGSFQFLNMLDTHIEFGLIPNVSMYVHQDFMKLLTKTV